MQTHEQLLFHNHNRVVRNTTCWGKCLNELVKGEDTAPHSLPWKDSLPEKNGGNLLSTHLNLPISKRKSFAARASQHLVNFFLMFLPLPACMPVRGWRWKQKTEQKCKISEAAEDQEAKESFVTPCRSLGRFDVANIGSWLGVWVWKQRQFEKHCGHSRPLVDRLNSREEFSTDMASQASSNFRGPWSPILVVYGSLISRLSTLLLLGNESTNSFLVREGKKGNSMSSFCGDSKSSVPLSLKKKKIWVQDSWILKKITHQRCQPQKSRLGWK